MSLAPGRPLKNTDYAVDQTRGLVHDDTRRELHEAVRAAVASAHETSPRVHPPGYYDLDHLLDTMLLWLGNYQSEADLQALVGLPQTELKPVVKFVLRFAQPFVDRWLRFRPAATRADAAQPVVSQLPQKLRGITTLSDCSDKPRTKKRFQWGAARAKEYHSFKLKCAALRVLVQLPARLGCASAKRSRSPRILTAGTTTWATPTPPAAATTVPCTNSDIRCWQRASRPTTRSRSTRASGGF